MTTNPAKPNLWLKPAQFPNSNWQASDREVKVFFGLKATEKWPLLGMGPFVIQGITCWVKPKPPTLYTTLYHKPVKSSKHRSFGICPACGATIPLGRMQQHAKIHKE
jgi:hypothetical protein